MRPDILDRNGEMLATDVKTVSVFAEPRRIIDKDEAVELLTAVLPDLNARELRDKLGAEAGFVWVKREITPKEQAGGVPPRPARHRLHAGEQARLSRTGPSAAHVLGFANLDNQGIAGIEKYIDGQGLARSEHAPGFATRADRSEAGAAVDRPARPARDARRTRRRAWRSTRPRPARGDRSST